MSDPTDYIAEAITEAFGERCPDFAELCPCCKAWTQYDELALAKKQARREALEDAANYHDDLAYMHDACGYESQHHEMMTRVHRQCAAAIRKLAEDGK